MLKDNHAPAQASGGFVLWTMAAGPSTVTFEIAGDILCALGGNSETVLKTFESHRADLCAVAAARWAANGGRAKRVEVGARDVLPLLNRPAEKNSVSTDA